MNVRVWWTMGALVLLVPAAAAAPAPFETPVLDDPVDYAVQPGLDMVSLGHWTSYFYDAQNKVHRGFFLNLCVGFVNLPDAPETTRVHLYAKINGTIREYWADVGFTGAKVVITDANTNATANQTSVIFHLPFQEIGLANGSELVDIFLATSTNHPLAERVYHDTMPFDNANRPVLQPNVPQERGSLVIGQVYPFLTLSPNGTLAAESILGLPAKFRVTVTPAAGISNDVVRFFPQVSPGWNLTPNFEYLGPFGEQPMEMVFDLARPNATVGDVGTATIQVISNSGAYEVLHLTANVVSGLTFSAQRFSQPDLTDVRAGQLRQLEFKILDATGSPKPNARVQLEAHHHGRLIGSTNETTDANGTARWEFRFDRAGTWTLRATLIDEKPTPFVEYHVEVASRASAPGAPLWAAVLAVAFLVPFLRRR